ncbi:MAG: SurA N-terminal domain-containing protein [Bacteroidota bacterium]|nr:SurA N-terminal domain-containing protein [Bacteroidota bacterium]
MKSAIFLSILFLGLGALSRDAISQVTNYAPFPGDTAGIVDGHVISKKAYVDMFLEVAREEKDNEGKTKLTPEEKLLDIHRKTWDRLVIGAILEENIEKKGITTSDAEVRSSLEKDPPEFLKHGFVDSLGTFHREDYLQALRDPRNDSVVRNLVKLLAQDMQKRKLSNALIASITVTDDELWEDYRKQKGATRKKFEAEKESLRPVKLQEKQSTFMVSWVESSKANAKIIDYRTIK